MDQATDFLAKLIDNLEAIALALTALLGWLNRRELTSRTGRKRVKSEGRKPKTIAQLVEDQRLDLISMKEQQVDLSVGLITHLTSTHGDDEARELAESLRRRLSAEPRHPRSSTLDDKRGRADG